MNKLDEKDAFWRWTATLDLEIRQEICTWSARQGWYARANLYKSDDPDKQLSDLIAAIYNLIDEARNCERLAGSYAGTIDSVNAYGGAQHDDPLCAIFHRLHYAMLDVDAVFNQDKGGAA